MRNPFKIDEPACISFSGGRTSAYMLWEVIQAYGGSLPEYIVVCFSNTGKEDEATLRFVKRCSEEWGVNIIWIEYRDTEERFVLVDFETASRNGEPFEALIRKRNYLPNPVTRFCTIDLKIRPIGRYLLSIGMAETKNEAENMSIIGIRADEPSRIAKIADRSRLPLVRAGITKKEVGEFWQRQSFDLELPNMNGVTMHGNCDLCFLKGGQQILSLVSEKPERAIWWAKMEAQSLASKPSGARFRSDRPSYAQILAFSQDQKDMFLNVDNQSIGCFCGD